MFTGIIEATGVVTEILEDQTNKMFFIASPLSGELKIDQSLSHNGICLTVDQLNDGMHRVTAIAETISKSDIGTWKRGDRINLERCLLINSRIDGHIVQGHVDTTATCISVENISGSYTYTFSFPREFAELIVEKGSVSVNGISLTAFSVTEDEFSVGIIPYTYEHTNIAQVKKGSSVNIEFDIFGKYARRIINLAR